MTKPNEPDPNTPPTTEPNTDEVPSEAAKQVLKGVFHEAMDEWVEKNKPAPSRTNKPNFLNQILGYGK